MLLEPLSLSFPICQTNGLLGRGVIVELLKVGRDIEDQSPIATVKHKTNFEARRCDLLERFDLSTTLP